MLLFNLLYCFKIYLKLFVWNDLTYLKTINTINYIYISIFKIELGVKFLRISEVLINYDFYLMKNYILICYWTK